MAVHKPVRILHRLQHNMGGSNHKLPERAEDITSSTSEMKGWGGH